jgi:hypothetical protein
MKDKGEGKPEAKKKREKSEVEQKGTSTYGPWTLEFEPEHA